MKHLLRKTAMLSLLAVAIGFTACGENKKEQEEDASMPMQNEMHMESESEDVTEPVAQEVTFQNENVGAAFEEYIGLKKALVASDAAETQSEAMKLVEALQKLEGQQAALEAAQQIAQTEDLNQQRTAFAKLTEPMTNILSGAVSSGEIYKQFCPMAFEGQGGYWLASTSEVRNPFYGDKMLKCGRVAETIK